MADDFLAQVHFCSPGGATRGHSKKDDEPKANAGIGGMSFEQRVALLEKEVELEKLKLRDECCREGGRGGREEGGTRGGGGGSLEGS